MMNHSRVMKPSKLLATVVAVLFFVTQILLNPGFVQYATASVSLPSPKSISIWDTRTMGLRTKAASSEFGVESSKSTASQPSGPFPYLKPLLKNISAHAYVGEEYRGKNEAPLVFLVQDIHMNVEAQKNIGKILQTIREGTKKQFLIGVEAASGNFKFSPYRILPDKEIKRSVADHLLHENLIAGVSWFGLTTQDPVPQIVGVDDPSLYLQNVNAYRQSATLKTKAESDIRRRLVELNKGVETMGESAQRLFKHIYSYHEGQTSIAQYIPHLVLFSKGETRHSLMKFMTAVELEKALDPVRTQKERDSLVGLLSEKSGDSLRALTEMGRAFKNGQLTHRSFYTELKRLALKAGIQMNAYPALVTYIHYIDAADAVNQKQVFSQIHEMEKEALESSLISGTERKLIHQLLQLQLKKKLIAFKLTPEEWVAYQNLPSDPAMASFEVFYKVAEARNEKMAKNLLVNHRSTQSEFSVLVAGGFHSDGLLNILRNEGVSYVVLSPKFSLAENSNYLHAFLQERTPLSKLFEGKKLTLMMADRLLGAPANIPGYENKPATGMMTLLIAGLSIGKNLSLAVVQAAVHSASNGLARLEALRKDVAVIRIAATRLIVGSDIAGEGSTEIGVFNGKTLAYRTVLVGAGVVAMLIAILGSIFGIAGLFSTAFNDSSMGPKNPVATMSSKELWKYFKAHGYLAVERGLDADTLMAVHQKIWEYWHSSSPDHLKAELTDLLDQKAGYENVAWLLKNPLMEKSDKNQNYNRYAKAWRIIGQFERDGKREEVQKLLRILTSSIAERIIRARIRKISYVSSEIRGFWHSGGIGMVADAFCKSLWGFGHEVTQFMPFYKGVGIEDKIERASRSQIGEDFWVPMGEKQVRARIIQVERSDGPPVNLIEADEYFSADKMGKPLDKNGQRIAEASPNPYFSTEADFTDAEASALERFVFFSKATLIANMVLAEALGQSPPEVLHLNDWHSSLMAPWMDYLKSNSVDKFISDQGKPGNEHMLGLTPQMFARLQNFYLRTAVVSTVHNAAYQGLFSSPSRFQKFDSHVTRLSYHLFQMLGIPRDPYFIPGGEKSLEYFSQFNFLRGLAPSFARQQVNTVSSGHAHELQVSGRDGGYRYLSDMFRDLASQGRFTGIMNGIGYEREPSHLSGVEPYTASNVHEVKPRNKMRLARRIARMRAGFDKKLNELLLEIQAHKGEKRKTLANEIKHLRDQWINEVDVADKIKQEIDGLNIDSEKKEKLLGKLAQVQDLYANAGVAFDSDTFVVTLVGRMVDEKGWNVAIDAIRKINKDKKIFFVLLGTGARDIQTSAEKLQEDFPHHVYSYISFDTDFANLTLGGDLTITSSLFEPCGLVHLEAMVAGMVPLGTPVGGISVIKDPKLFRDQATGFLVQGVDSVELFRAMSEDESVRRPNLEHVGTLIREKIDEAYDVFSRRNQDGLWFKIMDNAMRVDSYWSDPTDEYIALYDRAAKDAINLSPTITPAFQPLTLRSIYSLAAWLFPRFRGEEGFENYKSAWNGAALFELIFFLVPVSLTSYGILIVVGFSVPVAFVSAAVCTAIAFYLSHIIEDFLSGELSLSTLFSKTNGTRGSPFVTNVLWRALGVLSLFSPMILLVLMAQTFGIGNYFQSFTLGAALGIYLLSIPLHSLFNLISMLWNLSSLTFGVPTRNERDHYLSGPGQGLTIVSLVTQWLIFFSLDVFFHFFSIESLLFSSPFLFTIKLLTLIPIGLLMAQFGMVHFCMVFFPAKSLSKITYRLIGPLRYLNAKKISWLKMDYPVLGRQPFLFEKNLTSNESLYNKIPFMKEVFLADLHPSLDPNKEGKKIIVVNESNAHPLIQILGFWTFFIQNKFFYLPTKTQSPLLSWVIVAVNNLSFIPALVLSVPTLPIYFIAVILVDLNTWIGIWRRTRILDPTMRRYLEDYRGPSGRYKPDDLDFLDSNPKTIFPFTSGDFDIRPLSELLSDSNKTSPEKAQIIIRAFPPIHSTPPINFRSFYRDLVRHAENKGNIPQVPTSFSPLPKQVPVIDLTDNQVWSLEEGDNFVNRALENNKWGKVSMNGGAGRRAVGKSARVKEVISKSMLFMFLFNIAGIYGLQNALTITLNALMARIPTGGKAFVAVVTQDTNDEYIKDMLLHDPNRLGKHFIVDENYDDNAKIETTVHSLRGIPAINKKGGIKWFSPQQLHMDGHEQDFQMLTSPPGAIASIFQLVVDGCFFDWAEKGVRYVKVTNGDDVGGLPDGNEMRAIEQSDRSVFFSLIDRVITYTIQVGDKTVQIKFEGTKHVLNPNDLPIGYSFRTVPGTSGTPEFESNTKAWDVASLKWPSLLDQEELESLRVPVIEQEGQRVPLKILGVSFESGGTPVWDVRANRAVIKDDKEIVPKGDTPPSDPEGRAHWTAQKFAADKMRLAITQFNTNQANIHLIRFLRELGFWEGDEQTPPRQALSKARKMSLEERVKTISELMEPIPPILDPSELSAGSSEVFDKVIWKLADIMSVVSSGFLVIDRDGIRTRSAYQTIKDADGMTKPEVLERMAHLLRDLIPAETITKYEIPPPHFNSVSSVMMLFIQGSLALGREYIVPNTWGLPLQHSEKPDPSAEAKITLRKQDVLSFIRQHLSEERFKEFEGSHGTLRENLKTDSIFRYVNLLVLELYQKGWQIVVQPEADSQGHKYDRGIKVDTLTGDVTFFVGRTNIEGVSLTSPDHLTNFMSTQFGVNLIPLFKGIDSPSLIRDMFSTGAVAVVLAWALGQMGAPEIFPVALFLAGFWAFLAALAALQQGGFSHWNTPVATTDGKSTLFGQVSAPYQNVPFLFMVPHRLEEFSHFILRGSRIELVSHTVTLFLLASLSLLVAPFLGGQVDLPILLMAMTGLFLISISRSTANQPSVIGSSSIEDILGQGLKRARENELLSSSQIQQLTVFSGGQLPSVESFNLATMTGDLITLMSERRRRELIPQHTDFAHRSLAQGVSPILQRHIESLDKALLETNNAKSRQEILDQMTGVLGYQVAIEGSDVEPYATLLTGLAVGLGLRTTGVSHRQFATKIERAANHFKSEMLARRPNQKIGQPVTRYYSFQDIQSRAQMAEGDESITARLRGRLEEIATNTVAGHGHFESEEGEASRSKVAFAIPVNMAPDEFVSQMMALMDQHRIQPKLRAKIKFGLTQVFVHQSDKADPVELLKSMGQLSTVKTLVSLPIQLENWDFTSYQRLLELNPDMVREYIVEHLDFATGEIHRLEGHLKSAVESLHFA
ncbi:MAG: Glycogen synthase [Elusimicrobia bacterium]|nr:Glycogen synthase [Elusimicrobiota bacterium]